MDERMLDVFYPGVEPLTGASMDEIVATEKEVGTAFPELFRLLLLSRNGGPCKAEFARVPGFGNMEVDLFYGVGDAEYSMGHAQVMLENLPAGMVAFAVAGHVYYCFDQAQRNAQGEPSISCYDDESGMCTMIFQSFRDFLRSLVLRDEPTAGLKGLMPPPIG